jgi:hypothetical protein
MRFKTAEGLTVALYLDPKPDGRSVLVAQTMKLKSQGDIARLRAAWKPALAALAKHLTS